MALAFHRTPFRPCRSPRRDNREQQRRPQCQRPRLSDGLFLRGFCCTLSDTAHVSSGDSVCLRSHARGTVSLQRLLQRSSQAAVAWLRSAGGTTHSKSTLLENASQPGAAIRIQIFLVRVPFGKQRTVWEGADRGFANTRTFCPPSPPRTHHRPAIAPGQHTVCRQDPAPLIGCGHS